MAVPLIVTAQMGKADQAWADELRRRYFPPERNFLPAHITLFHHLPPAHADEIRHRLARIARAAPPPDATVDGLMFLGRGVALAVRSPELLAIRAELAEALTGLLVPQDMGTPKLHITVQNKVQPVEAKALHARLQAEISPRPLDIRDLVLWRYLGGPWQEVQRWRFSGSHKGR